jgi:hypothetical protein
MEESSVAARRRGRDDARQPRGRQGQGRRCREEGEAEVDQAAVAVGRLQGIGLEIVACRGDLLVRRRRAGSHADGGLLAEAIVLVTMGMSPVMPVSSRVVFRPTLAPSRPRWDGARRVVSGVVTGPFSSGLSVEGGDPPARAMGVVGSVSGQVGDRPDHAPAHEDGELEHCERAALLHPGAILVSMRRMRPVSCGQARGRPFEC